jgi:hypothetical protein
MAFPVIEGSVGSQEDASNVTSHTVSLPSDITAGELLLVFFVCDGNPTVTWPGAPDWTILGGGTTSGGAVRCEIGWKTATGLEGSSITITTSASERSSHAAFRISGANNSLTQRSAATDTGTAPNHEILFPSGGQDDYLWFAAIGVDRNRFATDPSGYPTNYSSAVSQVGGGANSCTCQTATRSFNTDNQDPSNWTINSSEEWIAQVVAVHPSSSTTYTKTASLNAAVQDEFTKTASLNAAVQDEFTKTASLNAGLAEETLKTTGLNAVLQKEITPKVTLQAAILDEVTKTANLNSAVQDEFTKTTGLDANLVVSNSVTTGLNAALQKEITAQTSLNAAVQDEITKAANLNAGLAKETTSQTSLNAVLEKEITPQSSLNAAIEAVVTKTANLNAGLKKEFLKTTGLNASLEPSGATLSASLEAALQDEFTKTASLNASLTPSTVEFIVPIGSGKDYTTVSAWITACKSNLTDGDSQVADVSSTTGGSWAGEDGAAVTNTSRTGTATIFHLLNDESKVYLRRLTGSFLNGDVVATDSSPTKTFTLGSDAVAINNCVAEVYGEITDNFDILSTDWTGVDATHYVIVRNAPGEGLKNHVERYGAALRYDGSRGAAITFGTNSVHVADISAKNTRFVGLQIRSTATTGASALIYTGGGGTGVIISDCLFETASGITVVQASGMKLINCIAIANNGSGNGIECSFGTELYGCLAVSPSDKASTGNGIVNSSTTDSIVKNTCSLGFATDWLENTSFHASSDYNASDGTGSPGTNIVNDLVFADQFEDVASATLDLRIKAGSGLIGAGIADETNTPADILGTDRPDSNPTIGAWEYTPHIDKVISQIGSATNEDFATIALWNTAMKSDISVNTSQTFPLQSVATAIDNGAAVTGVTSGATATCKHVRADGTEVYMTGVTGLFVPGEVVQQDGTPAKNVTLSGGGTQPAEVRLEAYQKAGGIVFTAQQFIGQNDWTGSANNKIIIAAAPGESIFDNFDPLVDPLRYDASKGAAFTGSVNTSLIDWRPPHFRMERMQIQNTNGGSTARCAAFTWGTAPTPILYECLFECDGSGSYVVLADASTYRNCVFIQVGAGNGIRYGFGSKLYSCTIIKPSDAGGAALGAKRSLSGGTSNVMKNTAVFGFANATDDISFWAAASDYNATDDASSPTTLPGANSIEGLTYADQFFGVTEAALDLRTKHAGLDWAGIADTTNYPADIVGRDRSTGGMSQNVASPVATIGAWEHYAGVTKVVMIKGQIPTGAPFTQDHFIATTEDVLGAVFWHTLSTDFAGTEHADNSLGFGGWDNTDRTADLAKDWSVHVRYRDGSVTNGTSRQRGNHDGSLLWVDTDGTIDALGTASEYNSGGNKGVTLTFDDGAAGDPIATSSTYFGLIFYGAPNGGRNFAADLANIPNNSTGSTTNYTDVGHVAQQALFMCVGNTIGTGANFQGTMLFGATLDDGSGAAPYPSRSWSTSNDSTDPSDQWAMNTHANGYMDQLSTTGGQYKKHRVHEWDGTVSGNYGKLGIRNFRSAASTVRHGVIAWRYADGRQIEIATSPPPVSGTTWQESGFTSTPELVLLLTTGGQGTSENLDSTQDGDQTAWSLGLFNEANEYIIGGMGESQEAGNTYQKGYTYDNRSVVMKSGEGSTSNVLVDSGADPTVSLGPTGWSTDIGAIPENTFAPGDVDTTNDEINIDEHTWRENQRVRFSTTGTLPAPLVAGTDYYIYNSVNSPNDTFQLRTDPADVSPDEAIDLTSQGTGTHTIYQAPFDFSWSINFPAVAAAEAAPVTVTTSLEAAVQAEILKTASLQAALKDQFLLTTALNAGISTENLKTSNIEAVVQKAISIQTNLEAAIEKLNNLVTTNLEAGIQEEFTVQTTLDASLSALQTLSTQLNSVIEAAIQKQTGLEGVIQAEVLLTASLNGFLTTSKTVLTSLEGLIEKLETQTTDLNASIFKLQLLSSSLNAGVSKEFLEQTSLQAVLEVEQLLTASLNASLIVEGVVTVTTNLNAAIQKLVTAQATLSGAISDEFILQSTIDAAIAVEQTVQTSLNAATQLQQLLTAGLDASLTEPGVETVIANLNAAIEKLITVEASLDGALAEAKTNSASLNSAISTLQTLSTNLDSVIQFSNQLNVLINAAVIDTLFSQVSIDAAVEKELLLQSSMNAGLALINELTSTLSAFISGAAVLVVSLDSALQANIPISTLLDGVIGEFVTISSKRTFNVEPRRRAFPVYPRNRKFTVN